MVKVRRPVILSLVVLVVDQLSKFCVFKWLSPLQSVRVIGDFMKITLIQNPGGIFGLQLKIPFIPITIFAICIICMILYRSSTSALSIILGGAIGNLVDRIRFGAVIDFLDFGMGSLRWPVFNIADAAVTIGIGWLLVRELSCKRAKYKIHDNNIKYQKSNIKMTNQK